MKPLYIAFNHKWKNKCLTKGDGQKYYDQLTALGIDYSGEDFRPPVLGSSDGKKHYCVNLATGWNNIEVDGVDVIFGILAEEGYSMTPQLLGDEGRRNNGSFMRTNVALIDIDDGLSVSDVEKDGFYQDYCSGYYTTKKHTDEDNRFRMIFVLDRVIDDAGDMRALLTGLIKMFGGDQACKDPSRLFYGYNQGISKMIEGKSIPEDVIDMLIEFGTIKKRIEVNTVEYSPPSDEEREYVIEALRNTFIGNQAEWLNIAIGLHNGGYDEQQFAYASIGGMMNSKTERDCKELWKDASHYNNVTMGTVWHKIGGHKQYRTTKVDRNKLSMTERLNNFNKEYNNED